MGVESVELFLSQRSKKIINVWILLLECFFIYLANGRTHMHQANLRAKHHTLSQSASQLVRSARESWQNDTHFDNTLLIVQITFNCPIEIILTHNYMWNPVMKHIVYYGPFGDALISRLASHSIISHYRADPSGPEGTLQYRSTIDAIKRYPTFSGYLFIQDDFHIDINSLRSWNLSVFWESSGHGKTVIPDFQNVSSPKNWWWPRYSGLRAVLSVLSHSRQMYDDLVRCTGSNDTWITGGFSSDFFYVPRVGVESFLRVVGYFSEHQLFVEVAIPTFMKCFHGTVPVEAKRFCQLKGNNLTEARRRCGGSPTMHHVKISGGQNHVDYVSDFLYGRKLSSIIS